MTCRWNNRRVRNVFACVATGAIPRRARGSRTVRARTPFARLVGRAQLPLYKGSQPSRVMFDVQTFLREHRPSQRERRRCLKDSVLLQSVSVKVAISYAMGRDAQQWAEVVRQLHSAFAEPEQPDAAPLPATDNAVPETTAVDELREELSALATNQATQLQRLDQLENRLEDLADLLVRFGRQLFAGEHVPRVCEFHMHTAGTSVRPPALHDVPYTISGVDEQSAEQAIPVTSAVEVAPLGGAPFTRTVSEPLVAMTPETVRVSKRVSFAETLDEQNDVQNVSPEVAATLPRAGSSSNVSRPVVHAPHAYHGTEQQHLLALAGDAGPSRPDEFAHDAANDAQAVHQHPHAVQTGLHDMGPWARMSNASQLPERHVRSGGLPSPPRANALMHTTLPVPPSTMSIYQKVITMVEPFYGNKDKTAAHLDCNMFIPFQEWFEQVEWKLASAGADARTQVFLTTQRLAGPALSTFMQRQRIERWDVASFDMPTLRDKLSSMFQDAQVVFSRKVQDMVFRASHLAQDVQTWRTYVMHSTYARAMDGDKMLMTLLREKMNKAHPQCLVIAQTEFQLSLDERAPHFHTYVDAAITIANRLQLLGLKRQADAVADREPKRARTDGPAGRTSKPAVKQPAKDYLQGLPKDHSDCTVDQLKTLFKAPAPVLAKYFQRCSKCFWNAKDHKDGCKGAEGAFKGRISGMREDLANGLHPNRKFMRNGTGK